MNLSTLTDRELTLLLGHSLYMGHALRVAARAEQRARLRPSAESLIPLTLGAYHAIPRLGWAPSRCASDPEPWARPRRERLQPCFLSESARAEMHVPRR